MHPENQPKRWPFSIKFSSLASDHLYASLFHNLYPALSSYWMQTRAADNVSVDFDWLDMHSMNPVVLKFFTPSRVQNIMVALRKCMKTFNDMQQERVN